MTTVNLMSGGLDSTVVAHLLLETGESVVPVFVDYGQLNKHRELSACRATCSSLQLPAPIIAELDGYGKLLPSGITTDELNILTQAFLPGRNALLLLVGAALAVRRGASAVTIGLLSEGQSLFPDQTQKFIENARLFISSAMGTSIAIRAPLMEFTKRDVVRLARERGITGTYSCHRGDESACGSCIACREYIGTED